MLLLSNLAFITGSQQGLQKLTCSKWEPAAASEGQSLRRFYF